MATIRIMILVATMAVSGLSAEPRYIGTASCAGSFWVDSAGVSDHATLFENSTIETEGAPAKLLIAGGARILLDAHSRAQVDESRLLLQKGRVQMDTGKDYRIEAHTIQVSLAKPQSRTIVSIAESGGVEVAALGAPVHVANAEGVAVANVAAGRAVELRLTQTSQTAMLTGCVVRAGAGYTLRDEVSAITVELRGEQVAAQAGRRVQVTGSIAPTQRALAPAEQVIRASSITALGAGCVSPPAESVAMTGSRARTTTQPDSPATPATTPDAGDAGTAGDAGSGGAGGTAGTAGAAGAAGTAGTAGAAAAGVGISTAVIAGVAVAAAAAGTTAAVVATQSHKAAPISPGR